MAALESRYMDLLKKILSERFVPYLPPLLDQTRPHGEQQDKQLSRAFSAFTLNKLLDISPQEASASVVDDINDQGIDAIYYDTNTEILYLLQAKLKGGAQFKQEEAQAFIAGVKLLLGLNFEHFNKNVKTRQTDIDLALNACSSIKLVIPYTGDGISASANNSLLSLFEDGNIDERLDRNITFYTALEITRDLLAEQAYPSVNANILLQKCHKIEEPHTTYFGIAKLSDLVVLHKINGKALYERNIRYFLGSSSSDINKAIKSTLSINQNSFFYLNNGITAVCNIVEPKGVDANKYNRLKVRGLSIINGAQTVASAAEFVEQHPDQNIDSAKVMFTLIKAPEGSDLSKNITKARNNQNTVQKANFISLDENQERLRQEIAHLGYDYQYRPEAKLSSSASITLSEAVRALALQQTDPRYSVWLKTELAKFNDSDSDEYNTLFPETLPGIFLINSVLCQRAIQVIMVEHEKNAPPRSLERLVYRHGLYVITSIAMKQLKNRISSGVLVNPADLPSLLSLPIDNLRQTSVDLISRYSASGPLAFFRNQADVIPYMVEIMEYHFDLLEDNTVNKLKNKSTNGEEYPRQRLVSYISGKAPQL